MNKHISILFVDDEPNVLAAIKRMLRNQKKEWDIHFAYSGDEALELFKKIIST